MTTHSQPHSTFLTVSGLRLHYFDWGNAGAPPVVCVHGDTSSAEGPDGRHPLDDGEPV